MCLSIVGSLHSPLDTVQAAPELFRAMGRTDRRAGPRARLPSTGYTLDTQSQTEAPTPPLWTDADEELEVQRD